ncbi:MAG: hypothetical protein ACT4N4_15660 [Rhodospirillales bacterium]
MPLRSTFKKALALVAAAVDLMTKRGLEPPVLVGGAAVELYTSGAVFTGDFDFVTPHQRELEAAFQEYGFERIHEPGYLTRGLIHRKLGFGVQVVSGALMDGHADRSKVRVFIVEGRKLSVIAIEDLIADRLGQAYSDPNPRKDMLDQSVKLYKLADAIDKDYLEKRIRQETSGAAGIATLERLAEEQR